MVKLLWEVWRKELARVRKTSLSLDAVGTEKVQEIQANTPASISVLVAKIQRQFQAIGTLASRDITIDWVIRAG